MGEPKTVLVVDDDADLVEQIALWLSAAGYAVRTAGGRAEAEETILAHKPDLAVVDLMMEEQDSGFVLCYELKRLYPDLPVIILTAVKASTGLSFTPESDEEQAWVKADSVLDKPVRSERLRAEVERLLRKAETARGV
jgi:CheY-like chemotaxis protein